MDVRRDRPAPTGRTTTMFDPADIVEPLTCYDCNGYITDHEDGCKTGLGITSDHENVLHDPEVELYAVVSAMVDFEIERNGAYWAARRAAREARA
ncbi:hypothetical protein SEA_KLIMBON_98 [Mycobacterium phage KlimbOn]|nr:hypothetical protein SEA_KLIMBON_98 [Mycobacterium phage KlimbOn]WNM65938.1 hypothetical protein SEA_DELRIVS__98 [Mycobacterium phage DelRivs]